MAITAIFLFFTPPLFARENDTYLNRQARLSFEQKFSYITHDIGQLSRENLQSLQRGFTEKRQMSWTERQRVSADAELFERKLRIQHATSSAAAIQILKTGELTSIDERVRRSEISADEKHTKMAKANTDGFIGEQDVVYLAIQDPSSPENFRFGPVTFVFNKNEVLELGYFTLFAYTEGSSYMSPSNAGLEVNENLRPLFKKFVFRGRAAYRRLIELSFAQVAWERKRNLSRHNKTIARSEVPPYQIPQGSLPVDLFEELGQKFDSGKIRFTKAIDSAEIFQNRTASESSPLKYLGAFQGFPVGAEGDPALLAYPYPFWELKIPRSLSLNSLIRIEIDESGLAGQTSPHDSIISQAQAYATRSSRNLTIKRVGSLIQLDFSK